MSIRDGLIAVALVVLLIVAADLLRRYLQRSKLRLSIDQKFSNLPDVDLTSELPNGGARVVVVDNDDALMTSPAAENPDSAADEWPIDPLLSGTGERDSEVDLLLEREFRGVGEGADLGLSDTVHQQPAPSTVDRLALAGEAAMADQQHCDSRVDPVTLEGVDGAAESIMSETLSPAADQAAAIGSAAESGADVVAEPVVSAEPVVALVESDEIDLERPVHELLQGRQPSVPLPLESATEAKTVAAVDQAGVEPAASVGAQQDAPAEAVVKTPATRSAPKKATKARRKKAPRRAEVQPSFFDLHPDLAPVVEQPKSKSKSKSKSSRRKQAQTSAPAVSDTEAANNIKSEELLIRVQAKQEPFRGPLLFKLVELCGLRFGAMDIFHRHEEDDGQGALQFSMFNAAGTAKFALDSADQFSTPAIAFYLCLSDPTDRMHAFDCMLETAKCIADNLGGELKDENQSSLRPQTIEHYRQKVREFERKQLARRD